MKKIAIIGTVGIPAKYGGFETLVEYLVEYLAKDYDITVFCSAKSYYNQPTEYNSAKLEYINLNANGFQSIPYDIISIFKALRESDVLLILGVSGCIILPFLRIFSKKRIVINIDGLEWKRDKWNKQAKWFLKYSEKLAVKYADVVISDNKVIQEYVLKEYNIKSEFIAYGADHVAKEKLSDEIKIIYPFLNEQYAFTVCRIEPENNIHLILDAFAEYKKFNIVIVGNWMNSEYGHKLKEKYAKSKNIFLLDPIYEQNILNQMRSNCSIYIHGHSAGGTNPSLVEAMYLGLPVFAFGVQYNVETTDNKAKYFKNKKELIQLLEITDFTELKNIGCSMKNIAQENYIWRKISQQYSKLL
jgi:glycosyltransferase involved in cell wall biosynthesis